ncbi:MAG: amino acid dehydrogenase [Vicinamibacteria bacterium]|nr:amino acid dehydrogenase [Vicinamibacteria bacterium]MBP9945493.1 amino acid dehydrogenase [Vicinamibacteria bacterium]
MVELKALELAASLGHEEVILLHDRESGLRGAIAIHDSTFGPSVGGTRMRVYPSYDEAIVDSLRLARAMTYKATMVEMPYGGAKAVIMGDPGRDKSRPLLVAYAKAVDRLGGRFFTGCDMGIEPRDLKVMQRHTKHLSHAKEDSPIDTSYLAALGVFEGIAAAAAVLGRDFSSLRVAIQGVGAVGLRLGKLLAEHGVSLVVADTDKARTVRAARELEAQVVEPEAIYDVEADVFSPNAMGGILNDDTIARLKVHAIVGGANEQLQEPRHGDVLHSLRILWGPDYVVNAGGLLSLLYETKQADEAGVEERVRMIGPRLADIWQRSEEEEDAPGVIADRIVEERLALGRRARSESVRRTKYEDD